MRGECFAPHLDFACQNGVPQVKILKQNLLRRGSEQKQVNCQASALRVFRGGNQVVTAASQFIRSCKFIRDTNSPTTTDEKRREATRFRKSRQVPKAPTDRQLSSISMNPSSLKRCPGTELLFFDLQNIDRRLARKTRTSSHSFRITLPPQLLAPAVNC